MTMCEVMERLTLHPLVDSGSDLVLSALGGDTQHMLQILAENNRARTLGHQQKLNEAVNDRFQISLTDRMPCCGKPRLQANIAGDKSTVLIFRPVADRPA